MAELKLVAVGAGIFLEVFILQVQLEAGIGPIRQGLPGPLGLIGIGGQVFLHRLPDRLAQVAFGFGLGDLGGVFKRRPFEFARRQLDAQPLTDPFGEAGGSVVVGQEALGGVIDLAVDHFEDHLLGGRSFEQALPERVDALALFVHDFVVFEQVFADIEVAFLDFFLGTFDPPADHLALDGLAFLHAEPGEHGRDPLAGELAHQVVFQRQEEPRGARVSLAASAAAELVIDAPTLVPLGPDDVQAPDRGDLAPLDFHLGLVAGDRL